MEDEIRAAYLPDSKVTSLQTYRVLAPEILSPLREDQEYEASGLIIERNVTSGLRSMRLPVPASLTRQSANRPVSGQNFRMRGSADLHSAYGSSTVPSRSSNSD